MGSIKRHLDEEDTPLVVDSKKRRRADYSQQDATLANIYNDLADEVEHVRLQAATQLIKQIPLTDNRQHTIEKALARLIKGVKSSRKAARLGFSVALTELIRLALQSSTINLSLKQLTSDIIASTAIEAHQSGQEKRDALLGRQFAFQAILQLGVEVLATVSIEEWTAFLEAFTTLANQKQWLRRQCGSILYEFINSSDLGNLPRERLQAAFDAWTNNSSWKTPEGVAIWLAFSRAEVMKLPKHIWHHHNPLSSKERSILAKVMQEVPIEDEETQSKAGTRQIIPSFAWSVVLEALFNKDSMKDFTQFWETTVNHGLFSNTSSNERKAFGLQIVTLAIRLAPANALEHILSSEVIRCIINHRSNADRYLFEAAKMPLNALVSRATVDHSLCAHLLSPLLQYGSVNFDQTTKTKTIDSIISQADQAALNDVQMLAQKYMLRPGTSDISQAEARRRTMADLMVATLRSRREQTELFVQTSGYYMLAPWVERLCKILNSAAYHAESLDVYDPPLSQSTRSTAQMRLMSCIGHLLIFPIDLACLAPNFILAELDSSNVLQHSKAKKNVVDLIKRGGKALKSISNGAVQGIGQSDLSASHALHLLLSMSILQVYNDEPDAVAALEDLLLSVESWDSSIESKTVLVEIILSFLSKSSALYKKLAEQVFVAFASSMTSDSLRSLLDILEQKESASGQQELFTQPEEEQGSSSDDDIVSEVDDGSDDEAIDVEDDSDVEISNGIVTGTAKADDSSDDTSHISEDDINGEEAEFDRKLAAALGTAGQNGSDDDSDMDDEEMMALEPHLASIFQERQKQASKKQDNKDARENIIHFKSRILDLLSIYVKHQYASQHAIELIHPLIVLIRTTSSKPTAEKAFTVLKQYFDIHSKNKAKPSVDDAEMLFALLTVLHSEVAEGEAKLHTSACSRGSLFLAKLLVTLDNNNYTRLAQMYASLQAQWYLNSKSKIQSSIFTEWTSWSITTRK